MLILAEQSLKSGNQDLALRLLELLFQSKNEKIRYKSVLLSYELEKERYFYLHDTQAQKKQRAKLKKIFTIIYQNKMYDDKDIQRWYQEALFVGAEKEAYVLLKKLVNQNPYDIALLKEAFYASQKFNEKEASFKYIQYLKLYDKKHYKEWVLKEYYMYMNYNQRKKALTLLQSEAYKDDYFKDLLAEFYASEKNYAFAARTYLELFYKTKDRSQKEHYLKKTLESLIAAKDTTQAVYLAKKYEDSFINNPQMRQFILKLYLSAQQLDDAAALSKKILKLKYKK
jgi:hypothetical protein